MKNRAAAQQFRARQKQQALDLEKEINTLKTQNASLKAKVQMLDVENKITKQQLAQIQQFIANSVSIALDNKPPGPEKTQELLNNLPPLD